MYKLKITARARRRLKEISKESREKIISVFEELKDDPFLNKPLGRELTGKYSYRVGVHRIIYKVNVASKIVIILTAGHRASIYNRN